MGIENENEELALWEAVAHEEGEKKVDALLQLSYNSSQRCEHHAALAFCETARTEYESLGALASNAKLAHIYFGIGFSLRRLKRPAEGALALERSVTLYQEAGLEDALHILYEEGDAWYEAEEYAKSYETYMRAVNDANPDICENIVAKNLYGAGTAQIRLKEWQKALESFLESRKIYKKMKDLRSVASCDEEISLCHYWLDNAPSALYHAQLALDFAETAEDQFHLLWSKIRLALSTKAMGEPERALDLFLESKSLMLQDENVRWKSILKMENEIAYILQGLGRMKESEEILRRVASLSEIVLEEGEVLALPKEQQIN